MLPFVCLFVCPYVRLNVDRELLHVSIALQEIEGQTHGQGHGHGSVGATSMEGSPF